jgi:3-phenylpropionate/trans-cinnamate dioxygenase ferredoxin reductase component
MYLIEGPAPSVELRRRTFYSDHEIELNLGESVKRIDRVRKMIVANSLREYPNDHLILAVGARGRSLSVPGETLPGVFQLRTLDDARALRQVLNSSSTVLV